MQTTGTIHWWLILGVFIVVGLLAFLLLWVLAPAIAGWRLESALEDAGFRQVHVETEGMGWREIEVSHASGRTVRAELDVEGAIFSYTLIGLLRGQARELEVRQLTFSYQAHEWPDWADLELEFPILAEEREADQPPFARRIVVHNGRTSLQVAGTDAQIEFDVMMEAPDPGKWEGQVGLAAAGSETVIRFDLDLNAEEGLFQLTHGRANLPGLGRVVAGADGQADAGGWQLPEEPVQVRGEGRWEQNHFEWDVMVFLPESTLTVEGQPATIGFAHLQMQGVAREQAGHWSVDVDTHAQIGFELGEVRDTLRLSLSTTSGRNLRRHVRGTLEALGNTAQVQLSFEGDLRNRRGSIEVREASLSPEPIRQLIYAATGGALFEHWRLSSDPLFVSLTGAWTENRFSWEMGLELPFGSIGHFGTRVEILRAEVEGRGSIERKRDDWSVDLRGQGTANRFVINDTRLFDVEATWRGDPRRGRVTFEGIRERDGFRMEGELDVRWVDDDWEVEHDVRLDLFQKVDQNDWR